jgi:hypothetical protein
MFNEEYIMIERRYVKKLKSKKLHRAWDEIVTLWGGELGAMGITHIPTPLEVMYLTALLGNRSEIMKLDQEIDTLVNLFMDKRDDTEDGS